MGLFDRGKKEAEAAKKAKAAAEVKANIAERKVKAAKARAARAEKELQEMKKKAKTKEFISKRAAGKESIGMGNIPRPGTIPGIIETYTVQKGDTLSQIAKKYYGSGGADYYNLIQQANPDLIKDVNVINPGQVFKIPVLPDRLKK
ncbi:MAG: LysM peptidoglycan-binding domain-containing protein [Actinomycetota bacterium]|nr:LysM peptidoglycan-binding domain-containing protein [Actinomycetota bacterium]